MGRGVVSNNTPQRPRTLRVRRPSQGFYFTACVRRNRDADSGSIRRQASRALVAHPSSATRSIISITNSGRFLGWASLGFNSPKNSPSLPSSATRQQPDQALAARGRALWLHAKWLCSIVGQCTTKRRPITDRLRVVGGCQRMTKITRKVDAIKEEGVLL